MMVMVVVLSGEEDPRGEVGGKVGRGVGEGERRLEEGGNGGEQ